MAQDTDCEKRKEQLKAAMETYQYNKRELIGAIEELTLLRSGPQEAA